MRHAKSSWEHSGLADRDRPLNSRGRRDAPEMGRRIAAAGLRPSLIVSSPATRAWETARIVAAGIGYPREFLQQEKRLYLATLDELLDVTALQDPGFGHLMLFGHNPGLTEFADYLVPGLTGNLPTAGILSVAFEGADWQLYRRPDLTVLLYDYPKRLAGDVSTPAR